MPLITLFTHYYSPSHLSSVETSCEFKKEIWDHETHCVSDFPYIVAGGKDKFHRGKETPFLLCACSSENNRTYAFATSYNGRFRNIFFKTPKLFQSIVNSGVQKEFEAIFPLTSQL